MKLTAPQRRVLKHLDRIYGRPTTGLLAYDLGLSHPSLFATLLALEEAELVAVEIGPGEDIWSITDAGRQAVAK